MRGGEQLDKGGDKVGLDGADELGRGKGEEEMGGNR